MKIAKAIKTGIDNYFSDSIKKVKKIPQNNYFVWFCKEILIFAR